MLWARQALKEWSRVGKIDFMSGDHGPQELLVGTRKQNVCELATWWKSQNSTYSMPVLTCTAFRRFFCLSSWCDLATKTGTCWCKFSGSPKWNELKSDKIVHACLNQSASIDLIFYTLGLMVEWTKRLQPLWSDIPTQDPLVHSTALFLGSTY